MKARRGKSASERGLRCDAPTDGRADSGGGDAGGHGATCEADWVTGRSRSGAARSY